MKIQLLERDLTKEEFNIVDEGFKSFEKIHNTVPQDSERITFILYDEDKFMGCSSGLAYKNGNQYNDWCYLTDLYIEKPYRFQGFGTKLLETLEKRLKSLNIHKIWTWTAGYGAPAFYKKQGYSVFCELENYYLTGDSRIGMRKFIK